MSKHRNIIGLDEDTWENETFVCPRCHKEISEFEYTVHKGLCANCDRKRQIINRRQRKGQPAWEYDYD